MSKENMETLNIDLSDLAIEDVELFLEEGSRGLSDFGASCGTTTCGTGCGTNSCAPTPAPTPAPDIIFNIPLD
jgi:hypothetical protein